MLWHCHCSKQSQRTWDKHMSSLHLSHRKCWVCLLGNVCVIKCWYSRRWQRQLGANREMTLSSWDRAGDRVQGGFKLLLNFLIYATQCVLMEAKQELELEQEQKLKLKLKLKPGLGATAMWLKLSQVSPIPLGKCCSPLAISISVSISISLSLSVCTAKVQALKQPVRPISISVHYKWSLGIAQ